MLRFTWRNILLPLNVGKKCQEKWQWHYFDLVSLENVLTVELFELIKNQARDG